MPARERNPFPYGRELSAEELVDREEELDEIARTIRNRGKLFLIGPRRYGKTSLLSAAAGDARDSGSTVLRFDAERYESLPLLARALLTTAARQLRAPMEKVVSLLREVAGRLRPEVSADPMTGELSVGIGVNRGEELPVFTEALDAVERMAARSDAPTAVFLDEVQQIMVEHGLTAEKQLHSTVQAHRHVAYVFAGSATRLLSEMTDDPERPFWRLGARIFVGEIPGDAFLDHLRARFRASGMTTGGDGLERILELANHVPYNVQRLAHEVWERLRVRDPAIVDPDEVRQALTDLVEKEDPAYAQLWNTLSRNQKKAIKAVMATGGTEVLASHVARDVQIPVSSLQVALRQLEDLHVIRHEATDAGPRFRLIDPFLAAWIDRSQRL